MTRKKKGANLTYYWCPTLNNTSWDENMPCDVDVHKITDKKSGGGKKEEEELKKKLLIATRGHDFTGEDKKFQEKYNQQSYGMFESQPNKKNNTDCVQTLSHFNWFGLKKN